MLVVGQYFVGLGECVCAACGRVLSWFGEVSVC